MKTKTRRFVRFFSFILTLTLVFVSFSTPAYALSPQQFNAWVAAAISAINITVSSTMIPAMELGQRFNEFLSWPVKVETTGIVDIPYTFDYTDMQEYLDRSVIQIDKDVVTIDGKQYTDIWLSNDAAEKFRVNAFDIENAFDIASHSEGTFVSGAGYIDGIPLFDLGTGYSTQNYAIGGNGLYSLGAGNVKIQVTDAPAQWQSIYKNSAALSQYNGPFGSIGFFNPIQKFKLTRGYNGATSYHWDNNEYPYSYKELDMTPFDFDWVSGTIPPDQTLQSDEGLRIRVPTEAINNWYVENPSFGPNLTINMADPQLSTKIDDLINLIVPLIPILDIDFTTHEAPQPQPEPEPIPDPEPYPDPLPDPDISLIDSTLKDIIQALKNIFDNISIGNSITTAIKNLLDSIKWAIDEIKESIGDLIDKLVRGNIDWFSDIIDSIKLPFMPWLNIFRLATNIWRHVTMWVASITAPLTFFMDVMFEINADLVKPFYAVAAAAIVIAIYKRFGQ